MTIYARYFKAMGGWPVMVALLVFSVGNQLSLILANMGMTKWTKKETVGEQLEGLGMYSILGSIAVLSVVIQFYTASKGAQKSSKHFHALLLRSVVRAPLRFFDVTPIGRLINRFSKDINTIDDTIIMTMLGWIQQVMVVGGTVIVLVISVPLAIIPCFFLALLFMYSQKLYVPSSRQLRRIESSLRSPVIAKLSEAISGCTIIRAFSPVAAVRFQNANQDKLHWSQRAYYMSIIINRWLAFRLEMICNLATCTIALLTVFPPLTGNANHVDPLNPNRRGHWIDPSMAGLAMTYTMSINQALSWLVRMIADMESSVVSVERVLEYVGCVQEAPSKTEDAQKKLTDRWIETMDKERELSESVVSQPGVNQSVIGNDGLNASLLSQSSTSHSKKKWRKRVEGALLEVGSGKRAQPSWMLRGPLPPSWPSHGQVILEGVSIRYAPHLPRVIKRLSLVIQGGERVGLVGRTGAGKSSLLLALMRLVEIDDENIVEDNDFVSTREKKTGEGESAERTQDVLLDGANAFVSLRNEQSGAEYHHTHAVTPPVVSNNCGRLLIDGVDVAGLGLDDLRRRAISVIPQDPVLFTGTVRFNLDPFNQYSDEEIKRSLSKVHLWGNRVADLEMAVSEGGGNLSVGERQLICIARAFLKKAKVLLLDEATSAIDAATDAFVQDTLRQAFNKNRNGNPTNSTDSDDLGTDLDESPPTIITIAHRINTILDYDKVVVLDRGHILEYDSPENLLKMKDGVFRSLTEQSGIPVPKI
eukprot:GDKJ01000792.1.p1 GENE.GDKJ01000792.1~~GDKJ01000792.1.p1  ORF type:complete len:770 (+),score=184.28 GDKJ01000792.1:35-2311(+)